MNAEVLNSVLIALLLLCSGTFLARVAVDLFDNRMCTMMWVYLIFFVLFVIPAALLNLGVDPVFNRFPLYGVALDTVEANNATLAIMIVTTIVWFLLFYRPKVVGAGEFEMVVDNGLTRFIAALALAAPFVLVAMAPDPFIYLEYGSLLEARHITVIGDWNFWVAMAVRFGLFAATVLFLMDRDLNWWRITMFFIAAFVLCYIGQKRVFVADAIILLSLVLAMRGRLNFFKVSLFLGIGMPLLLVLSNLYIENLKGRSEQVELFSERWLIDFSRYQNVVFVSYSEIRERPIMDPGASFTYNATFFVPREVWKDKPYPYAVYYTRAVIGLRGSTLLGWSLTTSLFDESIANYGFWGVVLPIFLIGLFCLYNDRRLTQLSGAVGIVIGIMFLSVHFAAFTYLFLLWLVLRMSERSRPMRDDPSALGAIIEGAPDADGRHTLVGGASIDSH